MSSRDVRAFRTRHFIMPIKIHGYVIDCDVREQKTLIREQLEEEEARREVVRAINEYYYGQ